MLHVHTKWHKIELEIVRSGSGQMNSLTLGNWPLMSQMVGTAYANCFRNLQIKFDGGFGQLKRICVCMYICVIWGGGWMRRVCVSAACRKLSRKDSSNPARIGGIGWGDVSGELMLTIANHRTQPKWRQTRAQMHTGILGPGANKVLLFGKLIVVRDAGFGRCIQTGNGWGGRENMWKSLRKGEHSNLIGWRRESDYLRDRDNVIRAKVHRVKIATGYITSIQKKTNITAHRTHLENNTQFGGSSLARFVGEWEKERRQTLHGKWRTQRHDKHRECQTSNSKWKVTNSK